MTTARGGSPWADLPKEILEAIGTRVDRSIINLLHFRSVCYSWHSAVPAPPPIPPLEVRLPFPGDVDGFLAPSAMCFVEFHPPILNDDSTTFSAAVPVACGGGWLIKIEESRSGKLQLLNPISNLKLRYAPIQLNLADVRVVQLGTSFRLKLRSGMTAFEVNRVALFPPSGLPAGRPAVTVVAIFQEGRLGYWRTGDERWTLLDDKSFDYDDLILHRGQLYVVDRLGKLSLIDSSSLRLVESHSPPQPVAGGGGGQKNLVSSGGDLYLIDRYLDGKRRNSKDVEEAINNSFHAIRYLVGTGRYRKWNPRAVDFKVYKLDGGMARWVEVKSLGDDDTVFVLTTESCFSVPAALIAGGRRDCIYYSDDDDYVARTMLTTAGIRVFRLEDRSIEEVRSLPRESDVFLPPGFRTEL